MHEIVLVLLFIPILIMTQYRVIQCFVFFTFFMVWALHDMGFVDTLSLKLSGMLCLLLSISSLMLNIMSDQRN